MRFHRPGWLPHDVTQDQWDAFNWAFITTLGIYAAVFVWWGRSCAASGQCVFV